MAVLNLMRGTVLFGKSCSHYLTDNFLLEAVILSIPFIVGQQKTMCQYEDYHSSFEYGGTTFAIIQGIRTMLICLYVDVV